VIDFLTLLAQSAMTCEVVLARTDFAFKMHERLCGASTYAKQ